MRKMKMRPSEVTADEFRKLRKLSKDRFAFHCLVMEIPGMCQEVKFHPTRKWRFDYALKEKKIAFEYEGIFAAKSRHTTVSGYSGDVEKYNAAQLLDWKVYRFTAKNYKTVKEYIPI